MSPVKILQYIIISIVSPKLSKFLLSFIHMELWPTMTNIKPSYLINTFSVFTSTPCKNNNHIKDSSVCPDPFSSSVFTETKVYNALIYLFPHKATGIDGICPKILTYCAIFYIIISYFMPSIQLKFTIPLYISQLTDHVSLTIILYPFYHMRGIFRGM